MCCVDSRNYKNMTFIHWLDIHERNYLHIFIYKTGFRFTSENFAEDTFFGCFFRHSEIACIMPNISKRPNTYS